MIEDFKKKLNNDMRKSKVLTCRNPFRADCNVLNYDLDTEDEIEEENGEDLNEENNLSDDDEDEMEEEKEAQIGFIVEDDYLSVSEMNLSELS